MAICEDTLPRLRGFKERKRYRVWPSATLATLVLLCVSACSLSPPSDPTQAEGPTMPDDVVPPLSMTELCASEGADIPASLASLSVADLSMLQTICSAWYLDSPVPSITRPKPPSALSWMDACEIAWGETSADADTAATPTTEIERDFLRTVLGVEGPSAERDVMCFFAVLDHDNDGILDYRISADGGGFIENDPDIDGDNTMNVRDADPVRDAGHADAVCGGGDYPPHLAFEFCANPGNDAERRACALQHSLYHDFDIVTLDLGFPSDGQALVTSMETVDDAVRLVFNEGMREHPYAADDCPGMTSLATLKTVVFKPCFYRLKTSWELDPEEDPRCYVPPEDESITYASVNGHNALLAVYPETKDLPALKLLGVFLHELAHSWTFALDFSEEKQQALLLDEYWDVPNYREFLQPFGWEIENEDPASIEQWRTDYQNVLSTGYGFSSYNTESYRLDGRTLPELRAIVPAEEGNQVVSLQAVELGLFGQYSLTDPWEWFADAMIAYVYLRMEERLSARSPDLADDAKAWFRARVLEAYPWNEFYHPNLKPEVYDEFRTKLFPIPDAAMDEITCRYLVFSDDFLFDSETYWNEPEFDDGEQHLSLDELRDALRVAWEPVCESQATG